MARVPFCKVFFAKPLDKFTWQCYNELANKTWQGGNIMKKEEILEMSRKENKDKDDERVVLAKLKATRFANLVMLLLGITFLIVAGRLKNEEALYMIIALSCGTTASNYFSLYYHVKGRFNLIMVIFEMMLTLAAIVILIFVVI